MSCLQWRAVVDDRGKSSSSTGFWMDRCLAGLYTGHHMLHVGCGLLKWQEASDVEFRRSV